MTGQSSLGDVRIDFPWPLIPGRLLRRRQRFLADVILDDGRPVTAHCPNSGSMLGCLEEDAPVLLSPAASPGRRTRFTWEMIRLSAAGWVGVNTLTPNRLVGLAAERRALELFEGATAVRREVRTGPGTRLDLVVERPWGPLFVEVKNVTLVRSGQAHFPDAVTSRGTKHLEELIRLKAQGFEAAQIYLVQRSDAGSFAPARDIDPTYTRLFDQALDRGVAVLALEARVGPQAIGLNRLLPLGPFQKI